MGFPSAIQVATAHEFFLIYNDVFLEISNILMLSLTLIMTCFFVILRVLVNFICDLSGF